MMLQMNYGCGTTVHPRYLVNSPSVLYVGVGGNFKKGTPEEIGIQEDVNTRKGVERIIRHAFEYARSEGRRRVTMSDKSNALRYGHDIWQRVFEEVAAEYTDIESSHLLPERTHRLLPEVFGGGIAQVDRIVVHPPTGPHESVEDVGGWVDDVLLEKLSQNEEVGLQPAVLEVVGERRLRAALPILRKAAAQPESDVRLAAIGALGNTVTLEELPVLTAGLSSAQSPQVKAAVLASLKSAAARVPDSARTDPRHWISNRAARRASRSSRPTR